MKLLAKTVTALGWVLLVAGMGLIGMGLYGIWLSDGFWAAAETLNPFNVANFLLTIVTLAPGLLLIALGNKLGGKSGDKPSQD